MDLTNLASVLQLALSPNTDERNHAENQLKQFQHAPGYVVGLLQIVVTTSADISVRQVASIQLKNFVGRHWSSDTLIQISESDRHTILQNLLEALVHAPPIIRVQLGDGLKTVVNHDYPDKWPSLLSSIDTNLKSPDQGRVYGALYALRILTRKYEFKDDEERQPVYQVIETSFPTLLTILKYLLSMPNPPIEVADLIKLTCKIFWSSVYLEVPKQIHDRNVFGAWMSCFHCILEMPVPLEGQPVDPDQRKVWGWWKVKKWTIQIINRLYNRFGDPKASKPENRAFALLFQKQFAPLFLESYLKLLNVVRQGGYLPDRIINLLLQFVSTSISKSTTYQLLKPHLDALVFEIIFPLMCFNDADYKLWHEDPHEYVRKGYDIIEDMYSSRTAAINFIAELLRKKGKENLQKFLAFIAGIFQGYEGAPSDQKPYRQKDGALLAVGALSDKLKETEPYKSQLEQMLVHHVFPEFSSPVGHLRAKAAWVSGQYAGTSFIDKQHFSAALRSVVAALRDPELPVRVDSVVALRSFVESCKDLDEVRPILPQLLDEFFKLMNEVENEDLVFTLETIVDKFGEEMAPYALGLCQNLAAAFWKCIQSSEGEDEEDDSAALAAVACLRAISTILESVSKLPDLFPQLEPTLLPILQRMLSTDGQDIFEELLEIVSYLTYISPTISRDLWSLWPPIVSALEEWAIDFFENILVPLDNYISRSTEHFLACKEPDYQQSLFKVISRVLADRNFEDNDVEPAPKLIEAVLQNCKGRADGWVEPYLKITVERLRRTEKGFLKDLLIEVVANSLYYNPGLSLSILQRMGVIAEVFQVWFTLLQEQKKSGQPAHFRREHDKKVCILGLLSLLPLPADLMPQEVQAGLDQIFKAVLQLLVTYKQQLEESAKKEHNTDEDEELENSESDRDSWENDLEDDDDDEDTDDANAEKLQKLAAKASAFRRHSQTDEDSDDDFMDDEEFQAPIDNVDPFILFAEIMQGMSVSDPARFQAYTHALDPQQQGIANSILLHAEERRKAKQKDSS